MPLVSSDTSLCLRIFFSNLFMAAFPSLLMIHWLQYPFGLTIEPRYRKCLTFFIFFTANIMATFCNYPVFILFCLFNTELWFCFSILFTFYSTHFKLLLFFGNNMASLSYLKIIHNFFHQFSLFHLNLFQLVCVMFWIKEIKCNFVWHLAKWKCVRKIKWPIISSRIICSL